MSSDLRVAQAQLAHRLIQEHAPGLVARCRNQWHSWQSHDGEEEAGSHMRPRIHVVARLWTPDDLDIAMGLAQMLELPWLDATVVVAFPTDTTVRYFQKKGLGRLVQAIPSSQLSDSLARLQDDALLCFVPPLSILTVDYLQALQDVIDRRHDAISDLSGAGVFRASAWRGGSHDVANDHQHQNLAFSFLSLLRSGVFQTFERCCALILDHFQRAARKRQPVAARMRSLPAPSSFKMDSTRIKISAASGTEELIVSALPNTAQTTRRILYRRVLGLLDARESLKIEPPLECVGELPLQGEIILRAESETSRLPISLHLSPSRLEPWMVTCYLNRGGAGNPVMRAFADGIGCALRYAEDETDQRPGVPIVWGVLRGSNRVIAFAKQSKQYFFYVDHAYFSRGHGANYRITRNGYEAGRVRKCPPDRLAVHGIALQPWRKQGSGILVCPPTDYFMAAHNCQDWLEKTLDSLRLHTDRPIVVRRKPQPGETVEPLDQALQKAHALVTHSSNVAIEAAIAGTPVFVSPSSAAAPVGLTDLARIEHPVYPDREAWLAHLAYSQFSFEEIRSGAAWHLLLEWEEREFV